MSKNVIGRVSRTGTKPLDIGDGLHVVRQGWDPYGNHCVWVSRGGERARKIQTNGNLPEVHESCRGRTATITEGGSEEIKAYCAKFWPRKKRSR